MSEKSPRLRLVMIDIFYYVDVNKVLANCSWYIMFMLKHEYLESLYIHLRIPKAYGSLVSLYALPDASDSYTEILSWTRRTDLILNRIHTETGQDCLKTSEFKKVLIQQEAVSHNCF